MTCPHITGQVDFLTFGNKRWGLMGPVGVHQFPRSRKPMVVQVQEQVQERAQETWNQLTQDALDDAVHGTLMLTLNPS